MLSFFPLDGFLSFFKDQVIIGVWVFNSIPLTYLFVIVPIPCRFDHNSSVEQLEFRDGDSAKSSFTIENSFHCPGLFVFQMNLKIALSSYMQN